MAISKIVYKSSPQATGEVWMDATPATAAAADITSPKTAMLANGVVTTGTGSGGGGGDTEAEEKDVNFIDYDGKIVYSYTAVEAQALSALPANPSHSGLTAQGWNWSLSDIKTQLTNVGGRVWVGQMYITDDGKTRIYLHFPDNYRLSPYLALCPDGTVTIDWGDNSSTDTLTGTSLTTTKFIQHTYPSAGHYTMTLTATSGSFAFYGTNNTPSFLRLDTGTTTVTGQGSYVYLNAIEKIEIGENAHIEDYGLRYCSFLKSISIPQGCSIGTYALSYCVALKAITLPDDIVSMGTYQLAYDYGLRAICIPYSFKDSPSSYCMSGSRSLSSITIPYGVTAIGANAYNGYGFSSVFIPSTVISIANGGINYCYGTKEVHVKATTPPTLGGTTAIGYLPSDCVIYVPYSADHSILNAYKTATNWSTYASQMQEESA